MKMSVSLPDDEVDFLDAYARSEGYASRSSVVLKAVRLLRESQLSSAYEDAWAQWHDGSDEQAWDATAADGLD